MNKDTKEAIDRILKDEGTWNIVKSSSNVGELANRVYTAIHKHKDFKPAVDLDKELIIDYFNDILNGEGE